ncbi:MAG: rod shape-determining protein MreB [Bacillota bacterium]|jgi:rod shape-determining protein MreB
MLGLVSDIGIDLGTASIIVFVKGKGIVLREPSVVAMDRDTRKILAIGTEARKMIGRTPGNIVAIRPLREGVIADYDITEAMLKHFLAQVCGRRALVRPRIMVCVPSGVTSFEKKAVLEAAQQAGAGKAFVIEEPLAAALGACLDISKPSASMVVDIGGGTTDIAVLSLGGIVLSESLRIGGDKMDEAISRYMKREHNLAIGERTAEEIKISVGTACPGSREVNMEVRGRDLVTGMPKTVPVYSSEVAKAISECLTAILDGVHRVLEKTPPEMSADIMDKGIVLTGGGALLDGLDSLLVKATGVPVHIADDPISCVAMGTGKALEYSEVYQDHLKVLERVL